MAEPLFTAQLTQRQRQENERGTLLRVPIVKAVTTVTSAGNTTIWTVTAGKFLYVQGFSACNIAGGAATLTVYLVPSGGSAANGNKVYDALAMATNTSTTLDALVGQIIDPGAAIVATSGDATGINLWLSGYEAIGGDFL